MENNNKNIEIRLIYIIMFVALVTVGAVKVVKTYNNYKIGMIEKSCIGAINSSEEIQVLNIAKRENGSITTRSQNITRGSREEELVKIETNIVNEEFADSTDMEVEENAPAPVEEQVIEPSISISDVKISKSMDLTQRTGLSRKDFIDLISGLKVDTSGFFEENAGLIYDLCEEYSLNEIFFCGLISAESAWNIAQNHRNTHNYISLMSNGKLKYFPSVEAGLREAARVLHVNYLTPGGKFYHGKTLKGVQTKFCPNSGWIDLVYGRMKQII